MNAHMEHDVCQAAGPVSHLAICPDARAEMMHIRNSLPDEVVVQRIDERLNSLGNCISCNGLRCPGPPGH